MQSKKEGIDRFLSCILFVSVSRLVTDGTSIHHHPRPIIGKPQRKVGRLFFFFGAPSLLLTFLFASPLTSSFTFVPFLFSFLFPPHPNTHNPFLHKPHPLSHSPALLSQPILQTTFTLATEKVPAHESHRESIDRRHGQPSLRQLNCSSGAAHSGIECRACQRVLLQLKLCLPSQNPRQRKSLLVPLGFAFLLGRSV